MRASGVFLLVAALGSAPAACRIEGGAPVAGADTIHIAPAGILGLVPFDMLRRPDGIRLGETVVTFDPDDLPPARWWPNPGRDPVTCAIDTTAISSKSIYRFHKTTARRPYNDRSQAHSDVEDVLMVNERGERVSFICAKSR